MLKSILKFIVVTLVGLGIIGVLVGWYIIFESWYDSLPIPR